MECSVGGCRAPVEAIGLCAGHRKRKVRGLEVNVPLSAPRGGLSPWQLLEKALEEYWECDVRDDPAFAAAKQRVTYAARVYANTLPPLRKNLSYAQKKALGHGRRR